MALSADSIVGVIKESRPIRPRHNKHLFHATNIISESCDLREVGQEEKRRSIFQLTTEFLAHFNLDTRRGDGTYKAVKRLRQKTAGIFSIDIWNRP